MTTLPPEDAFMPSEDDEMVLPDNGKAGELFLAACELNLEERTKFLRQECGSNHELLAEIESLLKFDQVGGETFGHPALGEGFNLQAMTKDAPDGLELPNFLGKYQILAEIGVGGMGVVYRALQRNPNREVALKVIRPGLTGEQALQRFQLEAMILGRLQHPGIAQIFEAGTEDTGHGLQPFFAMELVEGATLVEYVEKRGLPLRDRLNLLAKICDAVQYSHQKGVIHRDLKPGNILVDANGQPKVLDFGVARSTNSDVQLTTLSASTNKIIGTLPYMSPEQIAGDPAEIDTRSDIYSLGVMAYEILTGHRPYQLENMNLAEMARVIAEVDPNLIGKYNRIFRGDLETIVAKAIEKDKCRRYESASDLAADLRRYLNDEPIAARPSSALYQLSKFSRRNKGLAALTAAVVFLVLPILSGFGMWIITHRDDVKAQQALEAIAFADGELQRGFFELYEEMEPKKAEARFRAVLAGTIIGNEFHQKADAIAGLAFAVAESSGAEAGVKVLHEFRSEMEAIPDLVRVEAAIWETNENSAKAEAILASLPEPTTTIGWSLEGRRWIAKGNNLEKGNDQEVFVKARDSFHRAILLSPKSKPLDFIGMAEAMARLRLPGPFLLPIAEALKENWPENPFTVFYGAEALKGQTESGRESTPRELHSAEAYYRIALQLDPENFRFHYNFANFLDDIGGDAEAEMEYREAIRIFPEFSWAHHNLGNLHFKKGLLQEAEKEYRASIHFDGQSALAHYNLADVLFETNRLEEAEVEYREAIRMNPKDFGYHLDFGRLLYKMGRPDEAEAKFRAAISLSPDNPISHYNLGRLLDEMNQLDEAETEYREAIRLNPNDSSSHNNLGWILHKTGRLKEAEAEYREAIRADPNSPSPHNNLAEFLFFADRLDEAEHEFRLAIQLDENYAQAHYNFSQFLAATFQPQEAELEFQIAIRLDPQNSEIHSDFGALLFNIGREAEAEKEIREAIRLNPEYAYPRIQLGDILFESGRMEEAHAEYLVGHELGSQQPDWPTFLSEERVIQAEKAIQSSLAIAKAVSDPGSISDWQICFGLARAAWKMEKLNEAKLLENRGFELAISAGAKLDLELSIWNGATWSELNAAAWDIVDPAANSTNPDANPDVGMGLRLAEAALELAPDEVSVRDTLAWALFANRRFDEALAASHQAIRLAPEDEKADYQGVLENLIKLISKERVENG
ncbi:MAG: tetratricopeptide repeat protein [Planctomycetes bacterium]|nr:tetratricopeptide repeat protein [Planctomycetota bacterium]